MTDPTPTEPYAPTASEPDAAPAAPPRSPYADRVTAAAAVVADRRSGPGAADLLFGLLFTAVGLWLFADITLGLDVPRVRWSDLWPLVLIVLGGWVLLGSFRRR